MPVQTIPPIEKMTSDQLADLLDAIQIERFRRCTEPSPEWHLKVLKERELVRKGILDNLEEKGRREAIEGIRRGIEDVKAGRVKPAEQVFRELEEKFGISHDD